MAQQGKVTMEISATIEGDGLISNVATNLADMKAEKAMNIDGQSVRPDEVITKRLYLSENINIGDGDAFVTIGDGAIFGRMLTTTESIITAGVQIGDGLVTSQKIDVGQLSAISADLGTITAGAISGTSMAIGAGGATIGNVAAGVSISNNVIRCILAGVSTVVIDGATGIISASKFDLTADAGSTLDLTAGAAYLGTGVYVGPDASRPIDALIRTYAQTTAPTGGTYKVGDLWLDTDAGNKGYRWDGTSWASVQDGSIATAQATADSAIKPGGGVAVDGSKYITTIDVSSGIVIKTSTSTTRTQITSAGMAIYLANVLKVQIDHTNGISIRNANDPPGVTERVSFLNASGVETGRIFGGSYDGCKLQGVTGSLNVDALAGYLYLYGLSGIATTSKVWVGNTTYPKDLDVSGLLTITGSTGKLAIQMPADSYIQFGTNLLDCNGTDLYWNGVKIN